MNKICPKCNITHERPGIFCSRSCSNSREWSKEDRLKKSVALIGKPGKRGKRGPRDRAVVDKIMVKRRETTMRRFSDGEISDRDTIRRLLTELVGGQCTKCALSTWLNEKITLQVDHIDGNAGNNMPVNLRLLCPNCHSQSDTFGARNKGNGRKSRGLPLK